MGDLTLRDALLSAVPPGVPAAIPPALEEALEAAGFPLDATAEEVADGRAWRQLSDGRPYADAVKRNGAVEVAVDGPMREWNWTGPHDTLAAAVAALEEAADAEREEPRP